MTFNLKDFKHMLALAEALHCDVALHFQCPGSPIVVEPVASSHSTTVGAS